MRSSAALLLVLTLLLVSACQPDVCPPGCIEYVTDASRLPGLDATADAGLTPTPISMQIGTKTVAVDRVIHGPLCNDRWQGTVYVACDLQIVSWTEEEGSKFLEGCDLILEPGTVVYVAAHNNAAYYKGCDACHEGGEIGPSP
jgi:hypothetical protein